MQHVFTKCLSFGRQSAVDSYQTILQVHLPVYISTLLKNSEINASRDASCLFTTTFTTLTCLIFPHRKCYWLVFSELCEMHFQSLYSLGLNESPMCLPNNRILFDVSFLANVLNSARRPWPRTLANFSQATCL